MERKLVSEKGNTSFDLKTGEVEMKNAKISKYNIRLESDETLGKDLSIAAGKLVGI